MDERTISMFAFTKSYAMDGWRLGYMVAPEAAIGALLKITANDLLELKLVDEVVPPDKLMERTMEIANRVAEGPSIALELTKRAVYKSLYLDLGTHVDMELYLQGFTTNSEDRAEGARAFQEKRRPEYKGR